MASEVARLHQQLQTVMRDNQREIAMREKDLGFLKSQIRERDDAVCARDVLLQELEADKHQFEQNLRAALDTIARQEEQSNLEWMEMNPEVWKLNEERDGFLSRIVVYELQLEALRKESAELVVQNSRMLLPKHQNQHRFL